MFYLVLPSHSFATTRFLHSYKNVTAIEMHHVALLPNTQTLNLSITITAAIIVHLTVNYVIKTKSVFVPGVNLFSNLLSCNVTDSMLCVCVTGLLSDWYPNLDALKESCRIASSYNWADVDLSPFQGEV